MLCLGVVDILESREGLGVVLYLPSMRTGVAQGVRAGEGSIRISRESWKGRAGRRYGGSRRLWHTCTVLYFAPQCIPTVTFKKHTFLLL